MPTHHSHLGIYALIVNEAGQILAIRKARGPYTGLFDLPGGSPEDGELLEQTLTREVLEETGCTVTAHIQLGATSALYPHEENGQPHLLRHIGILYRCAKSTARPLKPETDRTPTAPSGSPPRNKTCKTPRPSSATPPRPSHHTTNAYSLPQGPRPSGRTPRFPPRSTTATRPQGIITPAAGVPFGGQEGERERVRPWHGGKPS